MYLPAESPRCVTRSICGTPIAPHALRERDEVAQEPSHRGGPDDNLIGGPLDRTASAIRAGEGPGRHGRPSRGGLLELPLQLLGPRVHPGVYGNC